ncbi:MAG TPA: hypothetical protein VMO26_15980 [Vicinamibacterales bacterium]|nr:hypothetical protein [Vicinamibacterales bacterium]
MMTRRELITGGVAGSLVPIGHAESAEVIQSPAELDMLRDIARQIGNVDNTLSRGMLTNTVAFGLVGRVRGQMETFFRTAQKFPDFIDVGYDVFMDLYDWHVKHRQQLVVTRGPDGRYWMQFMFTTLIMRGEHDANYIGIPYDKA